MLTRLAISNLATIHDVCLEFEGGFTVLTGETGAGKSILIDAIHFVLGAKGKKELVRSGAGQTTVEAVFDLSALPWIRQELTRLEVPHARELVVRRTLQENGRSRALVNDCTVSQANLESLGTYLVNIHGQHDNQQLLDPDKHIGFLDDFGGLAEKRGAVGVCHAEYTALLRDRRELSEKAERKETRKAELLLEIEELGAARLAPGEEEQLRRDHSVLSNADSLANLIGTICEALYEGDEAILSRLAALGPALGQATAIDASLAPLREQFEPIRLHLDDFYRGLSGYRAKLESDPNRLEVINARLAEIERIKRRYGGSVESALALLESHAHELDGLDLAESRLEEINARIKEVAKRLHGQARELSGLRKKNAEQFDRLILEQLRALGMEKAAFQTRVEPLKNRDGSFPMYSPAGMDRVDFLLSANPGQAPRPFARIASGGELARTMLALKTILAKSDPTGTLIFDEVDTGISGALAEIVGKKLRALRKTHQVLCVTHLPQIAALGDAHLLVRKEIDGEQTFTKAHRLTEEEKVTEIARLLSGIEVSGHSLASAEEMLNRGRETAS